MQLISVNEYLNVSREVFEGTGALNAILTVDSKLFIDPVLLKTTEVPEFQGAYDELQKRFADIIRLLLTSQRQGDFAWQHAERLLRFPEVQGLCIGYSVHGTSGSGMGDALRSQILEAAKYIVDAGVRDPELFELLGLFQEGIGADRISDMTAGILFRRFLNYSQRIFRELHAETRPYNYYENVYLLPKNDFNRQPIVLVPIDILDDLPVASDWSDIEIVSRRNFLLRAKLNEMVGTIWRKTAHFPKKLLREVLFNDPDLLRELIDAYRNYKTRPYDFLSDPAGQINWYSASRDYTTQFPLDLVLPPKPDVNDVIGIVSRICNKFKDLVENNGLSRLLYQSAGKPKKEDAAQLLFYGIAECYCEANNLDLTRETNAGRGPVDFKISSGYQGRVLVETKLSTNSRLVHGFETQLEEYLAAEKTKYSIYLIIDVVGGSESRIKSILELWGQHKTAGHRVPDVIVVDAKPKQSASKYVSNDAS